MSTEAFDAIVIGAGHNGLVAANVLADAGWSVCVLEATPVPGGAVRTAEVTEPGFHNDLFSAFYPMSAVSPVIRGLRLDEHGLRWRHAPDVLAHVLPDDRCAVLSRDVDRTAASVDEFAPGDGDAWRELFRQWREIREPLLDALFTPFPPVRPALKLLRRTGTADALRLARMLTLPARRFGDELFTGDGAKLLLAGNAAHSDLSVDNAGSAVFGWLLAMIGQDEGFPVPAGGAGELVAALVRRLESRGGVVHCGRPVREVLVGGGRALGVRDGAGDPVRARKAVLADVPAPVLYGELVDAQWLPSRLLEDLGRFQWDSATVKVDWALSGPVPWTAEAARGAGTIHLGTDLDGLSAFGGDLVRGRTPRKPFLLFGQMTTADPSRSPSGTESAWAYTHVPRGSIPNRAALERRAKRIEETVEANAPGFTGLIKARYIQGPEELADHDPGLVGGAINGGTTAIHQQLFFRPVPGTGRSDTPVDRLYLAGSSAHPGGAVHGGPGANAARAALARAGKLGPGYAAVIRAAHRAVYG
ncbi:phytoene desaturase family protein [Amycolatopsis australiensis]|uniref:Pyridine nucleotide-disulfide oxidoreductase domain-containing protein 2 n=1 Tax=Amycolatopsis australiensis TaxID=546364 RepID=A0A1K1SK46_9PSEU|nr:NAD(P)/FAD-dependent oxidoreductase [Amycolatopsis australiensis]SFW84221.1 Phytoene dehydrogenase-related protein [Amycolatopsis australiensis]